MFSADEKTKLVERARSLFAGASTDPEALAVGIATLTMELVVVRQGRMTGADWDALIEQYGGMNFIISGNHEESFRTLRREFARLGARASTMQAERDAARAEVGQVKVEAGAATSDLRLWKAEVDRLKAQLASATQATTCARCGVFKHTPTRDMDGYICAGCLEKAWHKALDERDSLQRFKAYVHRRLDDAGVPVDPPSEHREQGCRIGGRLDVLLGERDALAQEKTRWEAGLSTTEQRAGRAEDALRRAGWTLEEGAQAWRPPLGPSASPLLDAIDTARGEAARARESEGTWRRRLEAVAKELEGIGDGEMGRLDIVSRVRTLKDKLKRLEEQGNAPSGHVGGQGNDPEIPESSNALTPEDTRKDCTCVGTCKGATGLGGSWRCALSSRPVMPKRYPCSATCTHDDAAKPGHPERVKERSEAVLQAINPDSTREADAPLPAGPVRADDDNTAAESDSYDRGAEAMQEACLLAVLSVYDASGGCVSRNDLKAAVEGAAP